MLSLTEAFFDELAGRHDPAFAGRTAKIRYELAGRVQAERGGERDTDDSGSWLVTIDRGDIAVSSAAHDTGADCLLRASRDVFDRIFRGETNAMAAMLRGELLVEGDPELLIATRRLIPASTPGGQS